jgi:glycosyltransferase involved in cell wall biosynthesis
LKPLLSIITPSYNQVAFLESTIRSVLAQDYDPIEYLIVDGASTDGSVEVIRRYAPHLAWWISEPDSGQAEALNKGFEAAQGVFIAWLNSDDLYLPGAASQAVATLQANPEAGMVYADALTIDTYGRPLKRLTFGDWGLAQLLGFRVICQPTVFMRREALLKAGGLDASYHYMLDHHLWIRIARQAPIHYARLDQNSQRPAPVIWAAARHHREAKNVAHSVGFSRETVRLSEWILTQPDLSAVIANDLRDFQAGAYRLAARYLMDGGKYIEALQAYSRAVRAQPGYALKHGHRMVYALLALGGVSGLMERLRKPFLERRRIRLVNELLSDTWNEGGILNDWPGLCLAKYG